MYFCTYSILNYFDLSINIINLIFSGLLITLFYVVIISLLFYRRGEYKFILNMVKSIFCSFRKKVVK